LRGVAAACPHSKLSKYLSNAKKTQQCEIPAGVAKWQTHGTSKMKAMIGLFGKLFTRFHAKQRLVIR
jgi:hypothetical protein